MRNSASILTLAAALVFAAVLRGGGPGTREIRTLNPPRQGFFSKELDCLGIPILAHAEVSDEALRAAWERMDLELRHLPGAVTNLVAAKAELHIIGRRQVTTDLPEWRMDKHVPLDEYDGLTRDERTRGMGGRLTSCGEENLLRLPKGEDRYFGRDICLHEFAHNIQICGLDDAARARIARQAEASRAKGLWLGSYAGSNADEYFAELTMWYFGGHGSLVMTGPKPGDGPQGLKAYDPGAFALLDDLYQGRIPITPAQAPTDRAEAPDAAPEDSKVARGIVAKLAAYHIGATTLATLRADAGLPAERREGWRIVPLSREGEDDAAMRVLFRDPKGRDHSLADLQFKSGLLTGFRWNN